VVTRKSKYENEEQELKNIKCEIECAKALLFGVSSFSSGAPPLAPRQPSLRKERFVPAITREETPEFNRWRKA
jgi:hypothetical protein